MRLSASYDGEASSEPNPWVLGEGVEEECNDMENDGVSLKMLRDFQADAAFLEEQVAKWLDDEWIPQECHRDVARIAAGVYTKVRFGGRGPDMGMIALDHWLDEMMRGW